MTLADFRRYAGLDSNDFAPWDRGFNEGAADIAKMLKSGQYIGSTLQQHHVKQGFVDLGKDSPLKLQASAAIDHALDMLVVNPTSTETFIRDPESKLDQAQIEKRAKDRLYGVHRVSMFGFDSNDGEIYADGEGALGGEWNYALTQADDTATNKEVENNPPKVTVTRVQGKTGGGWKIAVSKPAQYYRDVGNNAAAKMAEKLAKQGIFPVKGGWGYEKLRQKWLPK